MRGLLGFSGPGLGAPHVAYTSLQFAHAPFPALTVPVSAIRSSKHGVHCQVIVSVRGLGDRADRVANVLTAWEIRWDGDPPRLITAHVATTSELTMAVVKHAIQENDVVALRERIGAWPAGTVGTAVSIYDDAACVEISEDMPLGATLT